MACSNTTSELERQWCATHSQRRSVYAIAVPCLWLLCCAAVCANATVLVSAAHLRRHRRRRRRSSVRAPMLLPLIYSLSACDMWLSMLLASGLYMFTYEPTVMRDTSSDIVCGVGCCSLRYLFEAVRLGAALSAVGHLVAMAVAHYQMVAQPLRFKSLSVSFSMVVVVSLWLTPPLLLVALFASAAPRTVLIPGCRTRWLASFTFRLPLTSVVVGALFACGLLYSKTLLVLKRAHEVKRSRRNQLSVAEETTEASSLTNTEDTTTRRRRRGSHFLRSRVRTVTTAVVILVTSLIGWMPIVLWFLLTCESCAYPVTQLVKHQPELLLVNGIVGQFLNIAKLLANPLIYAYRVPEIRGALRRLLHLQ